MDPLDEQLSQLSLINSRPLSPRVNPSPSASNAGLASSAKISGTGKVASIVNYIHENELSERPNVDAGPFGTNKKYNAQPDAAYATKKVGPVVPPKPHKKKDNLPEVPQSSVVKHACEPLYSQRLQCPDSISPLTSVFLRKQPGYASGQNSLYEKSSKVTLDNPAILEQQLEALAHHKKQLEKKGLLHQEKQKPLGDLSSIPNLSSTSLIHSDVAGKDPTNVIYANIRAAKKKLHEPLPETVSYGNEFSNFTERNKSNKSDNLESHNYKYANNMNAMAKNNIYSNVNFYNDHTDDLASSNTLSLSSVAPTAYLASIHEPDDEVPAPPSPVSSSYSELRRATDIFSKKQNTLQSQDGELENNERYPKYGDNCTSGGTNSGQTNRQTYMNLNVNNEYNNYSLTLQPSMSQDSSDLYGYGSFSQGSSTYESIYEPINPRPPSQLSTRSNYLMYSPYANSAKLPDNEMGLLSNNSTSNSLSSIGGLNTIGSNTLLYPSTDGISLNSVPDKNHSNSQKEAEVEVLTDFLVNSLDTHNDVDNYGVCYKCKERVLGENSGCTAMDQIYHISCFTCAQCQINLQGKPFYALEGKPYCEYDYLQTLEKCSVCMKPILERILRATGKPYHPQCFTCIVCGNSLDGIPFTVDATNQNYCISDFHKKFAPRCCVCKEPIMPEPGEEETVRVVALDRSFHFECYKCEDCGLLLSSEAEGRGCYPLDGHVLCKCCNAKRVQMLTNKMTTEL